MRKAEIGDTIKVTNLSKHASEELREMTEDKTFAVDSYCGDEGVFVITDSGFQPIFHAEYTVLTNESEIDKLKKENAALTSNIEALLAENEELQDKITSQMEKMEEQKEHLEQIMEDLLTVTGGF